MYIVELLMAFAGMIIIMMAFIVRKLNSGASYVKHNTYDAPKVRYYVEKAKQYKNSAYNKVDNAQLRCQEEAIKKMNARMLEFFTE